MSWARERLGYFAYCGSEPMMVDFWIEMGFDVNGMCCKSECKLRPASCLSRDISTLRLTIDNNYVQNDFSKRLHSLYRYSDIHT